jgi:hypothetical protein
MLVEPSSQLAVRRSFVAAENLAGFLDRFNDIFLPFGGDVEADGGLAVEAV